MLKDEWNNLYPSQWKDLIVDEAIVHPAKFSSKLIRYIYEHMREEGWVKEGDLVIDPFGGVALGAMDAMRLGLRWRGIELEEKFVRLGQGYDCPGINKKSLKKQETLCPSCQASVKEATEAKMGIPVREAHRYHGNIEYWNEKLSQMPNWSGDAQLLQGDSRELLKVLRESGNVSVSSPPYAESLDRGTVDADERRQLAREQGISNAEHVSPIDMEKIGKRNQEYGSTEGQLGAMKSRDDGFSAAISSPPYAESVNAGKGGIDWEKAGRPDRLTTDATGIQGANEHEMRYGSTEGQLGAMKAGEESFQASVSSPPWEQSGTTDHEGQTDALKGGKFQGGGDSFLYNYEYGKSQGQLGNDSGDDFWLAARTIVEQVFQALAPGGKAVWVVKDFVKNKERVPFTDQWRQLCEAVGFVTLHEHHAMLVHHKGTQKSMFGEDVEIKTESKSFFRRLAEKNGSPRIDWEVVWCMEKPR